MCNMSLLGNFFSGMPIIARKHIHFDVLTFEICDSLSRCVFDFVCNRYQGMDLFFMGIPNDCLGLMCPFFCSKKYLFRNIDLLILYKFLIAYIKSFLVIAC